jgi:hypothetical protein
MNNSMNKEENSRASIKSNKFVSKIKKPERITFNPTDANEF